MRIDIATLFPEMCERVLEESIIGRAQRRGHIAAYCHNIRDFADNTRKQVDDYPYGGGHGMVMQAAPIAACCAEIERQCGQRPYIVFMGAGGSVLTQEKSKELAQKPFLTIVCGHYEGIDQRVIDQLADEEISIGDYVLTGGELPALVLADCVLRLQPGVLAEEAGFTEESHYSGLLEHPQYTRPEIWRGRQVPPVLFSGHAGNIDQWRRLQSLRRTRRRRPDLYKKYRGGL